MGEELIKEVIDVDYEIISEDDENTKDKKKDTDITINADPMSALISGVCGIINNVTNAAKEYGICKQQEQTKRAAIKAQMKIEVEKINAQKEICLKVLDQQYELTMFQIQAFYQQYKTALDDASDAVHGAIEVAKESKNFSDVVALLEMERHILKDSSEAELKFMEISSRSQLAIGQPKELLKLQ